MDDYSFGGFSMDLRQTAMRIALKTGLLTKCEHCGELSGQPRKLLAAQRYAFVLSLAEDLAAEKKPLQRALGSLPDEYTACGCLSSEAMFEDGVLAGSIG